MRSFRSTLRSGAAALSLCLAAGVAAAALSGAIHTTDSTGASVNQNIYADRQDVYLEGGPNNNQSFGLDDGYYYVRITDPSGDTLLGTSLGTANETPILVTGGRFSELYQLWAILARASDGTQGYDLTPNQGGEYKVSVSKSRDFANNASKTDNFKVKEQEEEAQKAVVTIRKFYDANANGTFDSGESYIEGWKVDVSGFGGYSDTVYTSWTSEFEAGDYSFTEALPVETNWHATTATTVDLTLEDGDEETVLFGNLCLGAGGGHTLGYWSNKNGQALVGSDDLAALCGLSLVDGNGASFDPASKGALKTWLLNGTAVNMANMLSVQLAAMKLNVLNGYVDGGALVYAPDCGNTGAGGDYITIADLVAAAEAALAADGYTPSGDGNRAAQEALKDALDDANNNLIFVQATPGAFSF